MFIEGIWFFFVAPFYGFCLPVFTDEVFFLEFVFTCWLQRIHWNDHRLNPAAQVAHGTTIRDQ